MGGSVSWFALLVKSQPAYRLFFAPKLDLKCAQLSQLPLLVASKPASHPTPRVLQRAVRPYLYRRLLVLGY